MDKPLVSIIVPVYNIEAYLRRCLDSLINQTYQNIEIILVDDGSTDNSPAICDEYAAKDGRVRVFHKENGGVSSARNLGLDKAKGEWIAFVDSDDYIHPDFLRVLLKESKENIGVLACQYLRFGDQDTVEEQVLETYDLYEKPFWRVMQEGNEERYTVWGRIFRKELLSPFRFRDGIKYGEDALFNRRLAAENPAVSFVYIKIPLYYYYARGDSAVTKLSHKDFEKALEAYCEYFCAKTEQCSAKDFYAEMILKTLFIYRYTAMYVVDKSVKKNARSAYQLVCSYIRKTKCISFKKRCIYRLFYYFPCLYRIYRILGDRTMLVWEKNQRQLKKERKKQAKNSD